MEEGNEYNGTTWRINSKSRFILYGASEYTRRWINQAKINGINIELILDLKASEKKDWMVPVITPDDYISIHKENDVIVIMLQNAMNHDNIAFFFWEKKCEKLLFVPMRFKGDGAKKMRYAYNAFLSFNLIESNVEIPKLSKLICDKNNSLIKNENMIHWISAVNLYGKTYYWAEDSGDIDQYENEQRNLLMHQVYEKNLYLVKPYWILYEFLDGEIEDCEEYKKIFEGNNSEIVKNREVLYQFFEARLNEGLSFFEDTAALATFWENGKLQIIDGLHRSIFLLFKGFDWIPVRCEEKTLEALIDKSLEKRICEGIIEKKKILEFEYPVEFPDCKGIVVKKSFFKKIYKLIMRTLNNNFTSVLDCSDSWGYLIRLFYREGYEKMTCFTNKNKEFTEMINQAFYVDSVEYISDFNLVSNELINYEYVVIHVSQLLEVGVEKFGNNKQICIWGLEKNEIAISSAMSHAGFICVGDTSYFEAGKTKEARVYEKEK